MLRKSKISGPTHKWVEFHSLKQIVFFLSKDLLLITALIQPTSALPMLTFLSMDFIHCYSY